MRSWMKSQGLTIQMKATEQFFPVVLFVMLYKVVPKCFSLCLIDGVSVVVLVFYLR